MDPIKLDFTIAVRNSESTIGRCISSIINSVPDENIHHIIVVDNGSTDKTISIIKQFAEKNKKIRLLFESGRLGKVRLVQAEMCDTEYVAYIDSDVYLNKLWLPEMSKNMNERSGFVVARLGMAYSEPYRSFLTWSLSKFGCVAIGCTIVKRQLVLDKAEELGKLHAALEDVVIYNHAKKLGYECVYVDDNLLGDHEGDSDGILEIKHKRAGNSFRIAKGFFAALLNSFKLFVTNPTKVVLYSTENRVSLHDFLHLLKIQLILAFRFLDGVVSKNTISEIKK